VRHYGGACQHAGGYPVLNRLGTKCALVPKPSRNRRKQATPRRHAHRAETAPARLFSLQTGVFLATTSFETRIARDEVVVEQVHRAEI
jgi:hypothetical protein